MQPLTIKGTEKTPAVNFNNATGKLELKGRSIPEDSIDFYKPIINWIKQYMESPQNVTEFTVELEYYNTSSSKCLLDVFKTLEVIHVAGNKVQVNWRYEEDNEDLLEAGEGYSTSVAIPFKLVEFPG